MLISEVLKRSFNIWQIFGIHITPNHFYQPIPDTSTLPHNLWEKESELVGININKNAQIELLATFSVGFKHEYNQLQKTKTSIKHQYYLKNRSYETVDGEILYCMIRHFKPRKIIEIGSGFSTLLSAQAILKNQDENGQICELIAIEPFPNEILTNGFPGLTKLIPLKLQDVPLSQFNELGENDILFIDSSHVLKIGSDVQYEYLEILPRLNKNVIIHIHDIFFPMEYHRDWIFKEHLFWNEQYLLQAFLMFNDMFKVLWSANYIHLKCPEELIRAFDSYNNDHDFPSSFWMKKVN
jgi:hypothetical protein